MMKMVLNPVQFAFLPHGKGHLFNDFHQWLKPTLAQRSNPATFVRVFALHFRNMLSQTPFGIIGLADIADQQRFGVDQFIDVGKFRCGLVLRVILGYTSVHGKGHSLSSRPGVLQHRRGIRLSHPFFSTTRKAEQQAAASPCLFTHCKAEFIAGDFTCTKG